MAESTSSDGQADGLPTSVLFVCYLNSIRSPMAEGLLKSMVGDKVFVQSCGLETGDLDQIMVSIMAEKGIDMSAHKAKSLAGIEDGSFDLVIAFTEDAGRAAETVFADQDTKVETWILPDPSAGSLDVRAMMNNYRAMRTLIENRLKARFKKA